MSVEALTARSSGKRAALAASSRNRAVRDRGAASWRRKLAAVHQFFGIRHRLRTTRLARPACASQHRARDPVLGHRRSAHGRFALNNGQFAGRVGGQNVWPVTYLMLQAVEGGAALFFYIVATFTPPNSSGANATPTSPAFTTRCRRTRRSTGCRNSSRHLPVSNSCSSPSRSRAASSCRRSPAIITMSCSSTSRSSSSSRSRRCLASPCFALFVQTIVSNKFIGHGIVIGIFVMHPDPLQLRMGEHALPRTATPALHLLGHERLRPFRARAVLGDHLLAFDHRLSRLVSIALARRGAEDSSGAPRFALAASAPRASSRPPRSFFSSPVGSGGWYYYNAHVLNEYLTAKDRRQIQRGLRTRFQEVREASAAEGHRRRRQHQYFSRAPLVRRHRPLRRYRTRPRSPSARSTSQTSGSRSPNYSFDRPFHVVSSQPARPLLHLPARYSPLAPGDKRQPDLPRRHASRGFRDGNERRRARLQRHLLRFGLSSRPSDTTRGIRNRRPTPPPRRASRSSGDCFPSVEIRFGPVTNLFTPQSDWISYPTTVSTVDDQIAISPGYLAADWQANGRHYYTYDMGDVKTLDFFAYLSGTLRRQREHVPGSRQYRSPSRSITLPAHTYDVDDMIAARPRPASPTSKRTSAPTSSRQYRIIEFPRYRTFAQSFPNTVPFSEGIGFIGAYEKPTDIDFTYFVTAHELGHQWWGHQLIGGRVQGSNMMSETLAEYSALMVMQQKYGDDNMHKLPQARAGPLPARPRPARSAASAPGSGATARRTSGIRRVARSCIPSPTTSAKTRSTSPCTTSSCSTATRTRNEPPVRRPIPIPARWSKHSARRRPPTCSTSSTTPSRTSSSTTTRPSQQPSRRPPDHKFKVVLDVQVAQGTGRRQRHRDSRCRSHDFIDIGVFNGSEGRRKAPLPQESVAHATHQTFEIIVDQPPTRAGIDPFNKLIDRDSDDNWMAVSK